jgi:hypothetical protein
MLIVKSIKNKIRFDEVNVGEVFSYDDVFYIKASFNDKCDDYFEVGVSLSDGKAKRFGSVQVVERHKDATLTINS